ncbi:MAG: saccharopine dehydrogenase NADP-binding domain-containing protein [Streptosporangiaceae bacterium]
MNEIWIVGATGRVGRAVAAQLAARHALVLVGRDPARLRGLADKVGGQPRTVVAGSVDAVVAELARSRPAVVVNLIGPFAETGPPIVRACPPGTHYVDLANELFAVTGLLGSHDEAVAAGQSVVTGAGFGVLATESVVLKLCADRPSPARVRVDALPMTETEPGVFGTALAGTMVEALAPGGRRYQHGRLVRARLGGDVERLTLPGGSTVQTAGVPAGELEAARRASGASSVIAASSQVPSGRVIRAVLPAAAALLSLPALRGAAKRRLARVRLTPRARSRGFSWAHARVEDHDGNAREGWLRAGEGMAYTASVAAEVATRLARNEGRPGAYTPGALFGPELAVRAGGRFILGREAS